MDLGVPVELRELSQERGCIATVLEIGYEDAERTCEKPLGD